MESLLILRPVNELQHFTSMNKTHFIWCILALLLVACGPKRSPKPGEAAPDFSLKSSQGKEYRLSGQQGKLVMITFWTDNCAACKQEFPLIQENYQALQGQPFEILAVYVGKDTQAASRFQQEFSVTFPLLLGGQDVAFQEYVVNATPTSFLIGPDGKVLRKVVGYVDREQIEAYLDNIRRRPS